MEFEPGSTVDLRLIATIERVMGPHVRDALADPACEDVALNPDGGLRVYLQGGRKEHIGTMEPDFAVALIHTLASHCDRPIERSQPFLNCEIPPHGFRMSATLPPLTTAPTFTIRRPNIQDLRVADYVREGILSAHHLAVLQQAIGDRRNVLVAGGTGSGKTTLTNALIAETARISPDHRFLVLEDLREIHCHADDHLSFCTTPTVTMTDLVKQTLRNRPDRIIVGEVRGGEAFDLLQAWGTGHPGGLSTVHANSAGHTLMRLESLVSQSPTAPSEFYARQLIAAHVDVLVYIARTATGRKVQDVVQVLGYSNGTYETHSL